MACLEIGRTFQEERSPISAEQLSLSIRILEDEIYTLRSRMEQTYLDEASFNSDIVIDISRELDVKINEYMVYMQSRPKRQYSNL